MRLSETDVVEHVRTITVHELRLWVREGWIAPAEGEQGPSFDACDLARVRLVCQLRDDLALGEEAVPVVLSLLDQIHGLRHELRDLARAVERQPDDVRTEIARTFRSLRGG